MRRARMAGIRRTVLFAYFHSDYDTANRHVFKIIQQYPDRFFGFAFVHSRRDQGRLHGMVAKAVHDYGFCGIKVHRRDARITREVCEVAQSLAVPVLYDIMGETFVLEKLTSNFPDVPFIIPHLGSFDDDWKAQATLVDYLADCPNLYADTSAVRHFDLLERAVKEAGVGKVIFGTDGPFLHPGVELAKIRALRLSLSEEKQILETNLLRLLPNRKHEEKVTVSSE